MTFNHINSQNRSKLEMLNQPGSHVKVSQDFQSARQGASFTSLWRDFQRQGTVRGEKRLSPLLLAPNGLWKVAAMQRRHSAHDLKKKVGLYRNRWSTGPPYGCG